MAQTWRAKSSQICNDSLYQGILPDLFLPALNNAETFLFTSSQKMSSSFLLNALNVVSAALNKHTFLSSSYLFASFSVVGTSYFSGNPEYVQNELEMGKWNQEI